MAMLWSEEPLLQKALNALGGWEQAAQANNVHIQSMVFVLNVSDSSTAATIIAEWNASVNQYQIRTQ